MLILAVVVAFIIVHAAFLKLTSSPEAIMEKEHYAKAITEQITPQEPAVHKESFQDQEPTPKEKPPRIKEAKDFKNSRSPSFEKGYQFHKMGDYGKAVTEWVKVLSSFPHQNTYTFQLLLACREETILRAFQNCESPERLYYLKWQHDGKTCYKVCMGLFKSRQEAESKRQEISSYFLRDGNKPMVIPVSSLIRGHS